MWKALYIKYKTTITYAFFGALTTGVNWLVHFRLFYVNEFSATLSSAIAWCVAVLFAFFTNKPFVFESKDWTPKVALREFLQFVACRFLSGLLEGLLLLVAVDLCKSNGVVWKVIAGCIVFLLNYAASKLFVFRNNKNIPSE